MITDIEFDCPECGGHLIVSAKGKGASVLCPECGKQIQIPGATNKGQDEIIFMCSYCGSKQSSIAEKLGDVIECSACRQLPQVSIDVHKVLKVHNQKKHLKRINKRTTVWKIVFFLMLIATIGTGTLAVFAAAKAWRVRAIKIAEKKSYDINVSGSVFIVTKGKDNIKLGLVPILVLDCGELRRLLLNNLHGILDDSIRDKSDETTDWLAITYTNAIEEIERSLPSYLEKKWNSFHSRLQKNQVYQPRFINNGLTDADGNFNLVFKKTHRERFYMVACSDRNIQHIEKLKPVIIKERYLWITPLTMEPEQKVIMANQNLLNSFDDLSAILEYLEALNNERTHKDKGIDTDLELMSNKRKNKD